MGHERQRWAAKKRKDEGKKITVLQWMEDGGNQHGSIVRFATSVRSESAAASGRFCWCVSADWHKFWGSEATSCEGSIAGGGGRGEARRGGGAAASKVRRRRRRRGGSSRADAAGSGL